MKFIGKIIDGATSYIIGICIGASFVAYTINQHPVMSRIINHEGGDRTGQFTVICAAMPNAHVKCLSEQELVDAN